MPSNLATIAPSSESGGTVAPNPEWRSYFGEDGVVYLKKLRKRCFGGATQEQMARILRIPLATYKSWEYLNKPSGPALSLLQVAAAYPQIVIRALYEAQDEERRGGDQCELTLSL